MTIIDALVIILIVVLVYVIVKWALAEMHAPVPDIILVCAALIIIILALTGHITFPKFAMVFLG